MLHVTHSVHVSMKWHEMTFTLHLCTGHHVESGVSAWLGSTLCLVFDVCHENMHGKSTQCWCSMYVVRTLLIDTMFGVRW